MSAPTKRKQDCTPPYFPGDVVWTIDRGLGVIRTSGREVFWVLLDDELGQVTAFYHHELRYPTRTERAVRIAKQAMGLL